MNENLSQQRSFVFYSFEEDAALGYASLRIIFADQSANEGMATEQVVFRSTDSDGGVKTIKMSQQWVGPAELRVAPGIVAIRSVGGHELDVYCFGGHITYEAGHTTSSLLTSAAPIFNLSEEGLSGPENVVLTIVDKLEAELAAERAKYNDEEELNFDWRLATVDPRRLYAVGLTLARETLKTVPELVRTEHYWVEHSQLVHAIEEAEEQEWWPDPPTLDNVLAES